MKRTLVLMAMLLFPSVLAAQVCTLEHSPDRIRIRLVGNCGSPSRLQLRMGGDNGKIVSAGINDDEGYWEGKGFPQKIKNVQLCTTICKYASNCVAGEPVEDKDKDGKNICVAEYTVQCDEPGWQLGVSSDPPAVTLNYTRRRPESIEQRGELRAAPGSLICDLAVDEEVKLKPLLKSGDYKFDDIPISHATLDKKRQKSWPMGISDFLPYLVLPDGRRAQTVAATPAEQAFVQCDLKRLTLKIEK
ncbi:MAG TPA: hypothetical protein VKB93_13585 [Thermoanaerobaculia bacterium]|nr:hypothetical protein [Thermoanaerobaculia bacterium]